MATKSVVLPSGAKLEVTMSPFAIAKALYMAMSEEGRELKLDPKQEVDVNFYKDILFTGLASKKIESALWECMKRATYNGVRITEDTFEPEQARQDYILACIEVAEVNVKPFMIGLMQKYSATFQSITSTLASRPVTATS